MCTKIFEKISSSFLLGIITLICIAVLGTAYVMENYFAIYPCQLCTYEQYIFMIAGILALLSWVLLSRENQHRALIVVGIVFAANVLLAGYHVAVQQHWVPVPAFCAASDFSGFDTVEALKEKLLGTPFVRCDQITWSLFGLSLAVYNVLLSGFLALFCWAWAWKHK